MTSFLVFAVVFLIFYVPAVWLRNRRIRVLALVALETAPKEKTIRPTSVVSSVFAGPLQYVCMIDGSSQTFVRDTPEYDLIQKAIQRM